MTKSFKTFKRVMNKKIFNKFNFTILTLYKTIAIACAIIHLSYYAIFSILGIKPLVLFNGFSVILYILLIVFLFKEHYVSTMLAAYVEICLHSVFATILIGWQYGFPLQIICLIPVVFYWPFKKKYTAYLCSSLSAAVLILLKLITLSHPAIYNEIPDGSTETFLYIYNFCISIIPMVIFSSMYSISTRTSQEILSEKNRNLLQLASIDPLTGLLNRRSMVTKLEDAYYEREKNGRIFSLVICDIDDFKKVNDKYGHDCGDYVLKSLAKLMKNSLQNNCTICRWGGEEILILFSDFCCEAACEAVEKLRNEIETTPFIYNNIHINLTLTFGVSSGSDDCSISDILLQIDKNLYKGKNCGKNCVISD